MVENVKERFAWGVVGMLIPALFTVFLMLVMGERTIDVFLILGVWVLSIYYMARVGKNVPWKIHNCLLIGAFAPITVAGLVIVETLMTHPVKPEIKKLV